MLSISIFYPKNCSYYAVSLDSLKLQSKKCDIDDIYIKISPEQKVIQHHFIFTPPWYVLEIIHKWKGRSLGKNGWLILTAIRAYYFSVS